MSEKKDEALVAVQIVFTILQTQSKHEYDMDNVWEIITDAVKWYFMECMLDSDEKPSFKLLNPLFVAY